MRLGRSGQLRWDRLGDAQAAELVASLERSGARDDLYALALTIVGRPALAPAARRAAGAIVRRTADFDLFALDPAMRWFASDDAHFRTAWSQLGAADVDRLAHGVERTITLGLLSTHPIGHVRERAVALLANEGMEALPWLLVRTVDWVEQVRARARAGVVDFLRAENVDALRRAMPLVMRMRDFTRTDASGLAERIETFVAAQPIEAIERGLASRDWRERRVTFELLERHDLLATRHLASSLADANLAIRIEASRALASRISPETDALRASLVTNASARIRLIGIDAAVKGFDRDRVHPILVHALEDPQRLVRATARYHLARIDEHFDVAALHRGSVEGAEPTIGGIRALADVGTAADWERLVPLVDGRTALACEALAAMARLDPAGSREMRLMLVDDARPSVSRAAAATFVSTLWETDEPIIRSYLASPHLHVRRNAMRLVHRLPGWQPVAVYVAVTDPMLVGPAADGLEGWVVRTWREARPPSPDLDAALRRALGRSPLGARVGGQRLLALLDMMAK